MLSYSELIKGKIITINDQPYEIVEAQSVFKGRGHSYLQTKLKNLATGAVISKTIQPREEFEEANIEKKKLNLFITIKESLFFQKWVILQIDLS